ncbi:MAG TPA: hypothetical protein VG323_06300 [Thermoanaerobaculia bacterium]|nr:hypothetical protein [Thermoanaerobaculia bacterium]
MKRSLALSVVMVLVSLPLFAQTRKFAAPEISAVPGADGTTFSETIHAAKAHRIVPNVSFDESSNAMVFPLVGNAPGANGTFFRSEATIVNNLNRRQILRVWFFPLGGGTCNGVPVKDLALDAFNFYVYSDFVAQVFGLNGLGSLGMIAVDSFGNADPNARVDSAVRIYTPAFGGGGASQSFQGVGLSDFGGNQTAFGIRHDANFRTNYGIFNYLGFTRTFDVNMTGIGASASSVVTVGPCSVAFTGVPNLNYGALVLDIMPRDTQGGWYGFASSVDNVSGDSWSVSARPN